MADRFIVVGTNDPRVPEDERYEDDMYRSVLLDTRDKRILGTDGGEPEDQSFGRSWSWVPDELNALAARIDALTEQLRRVIAGCEVALLEPDRTRRRESSMPTDPIESPEQFAERCLPCQCHYEFRSRNLRDPSCPRHNFADDVADAIRARDAAVRREALDMRPCVLRFALLMEQKLRENDHKGGWGNEHEDYLLKRLRAETVELSKAVAAFAHYAREGGVPPGTKEHVGREAADVANFAMMLADNAGALAGGSDD